MDTLQLLKDAMQERFKSDSVVKRLEKMIEKLAEEKIFIKYKDKKIIRNGMHFELIGVKASFYVLDIEIKDVDVKLAFITSSKLPKVKRDKVEEVKSKYLEKKHLEWNNFKVALWEELRYEVELEKVLSGAINLEVF